MCAKVAFIGTFFVAPFVAALPFLTVCVQMSVEVRVSYETFVAFVALNSVIRVFIFVQF